MFLIGLILGPALGLLAGDFMARRAAGGSIAGPAAVALLVLLVLLLPFIDLELRVGLVTGFLLGLLLAYTPQDIATPE